MRLGHVSALLLLLGAAGVPDAAAEGASVAFDIPAEPLAEAMDAYGEATGVALIYDTALATGRRSSPVHGLFTPEAAIARLLAGTNLDAVYGSPTAMTIRPAPAQAAPPGPPLQPAISSGPDGPYRDFLGLVQHAVGRALCRTQAARPGAYRAVIRVWVAPQGSIGRAELATGTGTPARDRALLAALDGLDIGEPPDALPQPLVLVILPRPPAQTGDCTKP